MPIKIGSLAIDETLHDFVTYEALSGTGMGALQFWSGLAKLVDEFAPLLSAPPAVESPFSVSVPETPAKVGIDPLVTRLHGPQIVVSASEPRYILKAANARWSSLYDALYSSHLIPETEGAERGGAYNKVRGAKVMERAKIFLDQVLPLAKGSHADVRLYGVAEGELFAEFAPGDRSALQKPEQFIGCEGRPERPTGVLFDHEGGNILLRIDRRHVIGRDDPAGVADVLLESLLAVIIDFEDSLFCAGPKDKIAAYRNWLGILKGSLRIEFKKNKKVTDRLLATDLSLTDRVGKPLSLPGRSLLMASHAAPHVLSHLVYDKKDAPVPECLIDAAVTALIAIQDLKRARGRPNSAKGAIYAVKPKLRGAGDLKTVADICSRIETFLRLPQETIKLVIMDESQAIHATALQTAPERGLPTNRFVAFLPDPIDQAVEALQSRFTEAALQLKPFASLASAFAASPATVALNAFARHQGLMPFAPAALEFEAVDTAGQERQGKERRDKDLAFFCEHILSLLYVLIEHGQSSLLVRDNGDAGEIADRASLRLAILQIANWLRHGLYDDAAIGTALGQAAARLMERNPEETPLHVLLGEGEGSLLRLAQELIALLAQSPTEAMEPVLVPWRRAALVRQGPKGDNRFEAMRGATRGLESGEAFRTHD